MAVGNAWSELCLVAGVGNTWRTVALLKSNSPGSAQEIFLNGWYLEIPLVPGL
ncbi:hypothetical protein AVEN_152270-1, partial [Araneus ventricosus]